MRQWIVPSQCLVSCQANKQVTRVGHFAVHLHGNSLLDGINQDKCPCFPWCEPVGFLVGSTVCVMKKKAATLTAAALFLGSFFVQNVPSWLEWVQLIISPYNYAFFAVLPMIFDEPIPHDESGAIPECCGTDEGVAPPETILILLRVKNTMVFNALVLLLFASCFVASYDCLFRTLIEGRRRALGYDSKSSLRLN